MRPLYLHIGLAKTGTTFLQALLAENRPSLRKAGFLYPFIRPEGMFHAAVEIRDDHARWGLDPGLIRGTWAALLAKAREFDGTTVISHEILAGATDDEIERAARQLDGFEVHLVVTARDLSRQVPAHWQEAVKNGQTFSFDEFTSEVLREPGAPDSFFWNEQDLPAVVDRWAPYASRVHLVTCPQPGSDPTLLWQRFADGTGIPADTLDPSTAPPSNRSLGAAEVHLLRRINAELAGTIEWPAYAHVVKRYFAQRVLSTVGSEQATTPESLREPLARIEEEWIDALGRHQVHGDLADLRSTSFGGPHPDTFPVDPTTATAVVGTLLHELEQRTVVAKQAAPRTRFRRRRPA